MPRKPTEVVPASPQELAVRTQDYLQRAKAENTWRAYRSDWRHFEAWTKQRGQRALPATGAAVAAYLTELASTRKVSTLERRVAAISQAHQMAGHESPTSKIEIRTLMSGIRREKGIAAEAKQALLTDDLRMVLAHLPEGILGTRDRALLLLGFAGAFRRSELVSLNVEDLEFQRAGLVTRLRKSKTDQEGEGRKIGIPYGSRPDTCPVRSLQEWIEAAKIQSGPLFRPITRHGKIQASRLTAQSVALVVKRYAEAAGKDSAAFSGHSLRAGHATQAAMSGASERSIMNQTGHRSLKMVRRYIREGRLFEDNAASKLGL